MEQRLTSFFELILPCLRQVVDQFLRFAELFVDGALLHRDVPRPVLVQLLQALQPQITMKQ